MQRGDIWWADLPAPIGRRPVVLISRNHALQVRSNVCVAKITSTIRNIPTEVPLGLSEGLPKTCVANCDDLYTVPKAILRSRITQLHSDKMKALDRALCFALDLP